MAQQDIRYYLNGLLLVAKGKELRMVATDGHRLAYAAETLADDRRRSKSSCRARPCSNYRASWPTATTRSKSP
jgi:hypothetical protein